MKHFVNSLLFGSAICLLSVRAQTTYTQYDQMAPWPCNPEAQVFPDGGFFIDYQGARWDQKLYQLSQSFTPSSGMIDFIDLRLHDQGGDGRAPTVYILLRSQSIDGPIVASTDPIALADGLSNKGAEWTRFMFPSTVRITPFQTYYFQPMILPDTGGCTIYGGSSLYTAGVLFLGTTPKWGRSLFFREGWMLVVPEIPEPSTVALALAGLPALAWAMRKRERPSLR
jgi:hypothetical protein